jgi:hypothetical protein
MRMSIRSRAAIVGCGVLALLAATAPVATAQTTYAPITLSPEESQYLCAEALPKLADRTTKLTERLNGGAEVKGSVANLKARAQNQRSKGHEDVAKRLDQRAERRAGRINDLNSAQQKLTAFRTAHCQETK